uniref:Uncharacterized protein n=1 Tax=Timema genevievae TaxID=629358 RepID=A0A7R9PMJ7_TIMGE|nr:unnamed protein product [Timema genevievae]
MIERSRPLALLSASLKPILWDGGREGERLGVASQPTKVSFRTNKNRWITETVDGASYRTGHQKRRNGRLPVLAGTVTTHLLVSHKRSGELASSRLLNVFNPTSPLTGSFTSNSFNEVALRVSHSSLMSSDRMKPGSGDWAVMIDLLQEADTTLLSSGSNVKCELSVLKVEVMSEGVCQDWFCWVLERIARAPGDIPGGTV